MGLDIHVNSDMIYYGMRRHEVEKRKSRIVGVIYLISEIRFRPSKYNRKREEEEKRANGSLEQAVRVGV